MSITRIFRVRIHPELKQEFEEKFSSVSVHAVAKAPGFLAVSIFKATKWSPNEYAMISRWENVDALKAFAGEQWNHAVIPLAWRNSSLTVGCITMIRGLKHEPHFEGGSPTLFAYADQIAAR